MKQNVNKAKFRSWLALYEEHAKIYDDLPDGAYFAAMEDAGFDVDDHASYATFKATGVMV